MHEITQQFSVRARWAYLGTQDPWREHLTVIVENGLIVDVTEKRVTGAIDLGDVCLLPGLVNAHTHLEFSHLSTPLKTPLPFTGWIRELVKAREQSPLSVYESMQLGFQEVTAQSTAVVGDILHPRAMVAGELRFAEELFRTTPGRYRTLFYEVIGWSDQRCREQLNLLDTLLSQSVGSAFAEDGVQFAISPHAPYSVNPRMVEELADRCQRYQLPVSMHLAETVSELEFLDQQSGEFRQMLEDFGVWQEGIIERGTTILNYLHMLSRVSHALIIHGNYLNDLDLEFLSRHQGGAANQMSVVYCPRTHHYFGHTTHRFEEMLKAGINVCLGTDSRGSNPDLSIWNEVRFLAERFPGLPVEQLLSMATWRGARALGVESGYGRIHPGYSASMSIVTPDRSLEGSFHRQLTGHGSRIRPLLLSKSILPDLNSR